MAGQDGFALGVDLGTSNTVAVLRWPDGRTRPLLFDGQPVMPSGVFADSSGRLHTGRDAQRLAQADPARYEPNPKRRIDEPGVLLGDREVSTPDLLAAILRTVAQAATEAVGFLPAAALTYPATWGGPRREVLANAVTRAGWPPVNPGAGPAHRTLLIPEPVAAARYFTEALRRPVPVGSALAVFDFGGGTLDIAVVRNEGVGPNGRANFAVIGSGGLAELGGLDLDSALVEHLGELISRSDPQVWQQLSQPATGIQWRDRRQFWDDVRGAKEMLSRTTVAPVAVPGVEQAVHLTRDELERLATPLLRRGVYEAASVISRSRISPDQLAGLFLVGGSSRVPLVARLLHSELGIAPTVLEQPELPVAEGALAELGAPPVTSATVRAPGSVSAPPGGYPPQGAVSAPPAAPPAAPPGGHAPPGVRSGTGPTAPAIPPWSYAATGAPPSPHQGTPPAGAPGMPYPMNRPGPATRRLPRAAWILTGAALALIGVVAATVLYLNRTTYDDIDFQTSFVDIGRIAAGEGRQSNSYTALVDNRAYLAYQRDDNRLEVIAAEADAARELWRVRTADHATAWAGITALPGAVIALAQEYGDSKPRKLYVFDPADGRARWSRDVLGSDELHLYDNVLVILDRVGAQLLGLDLRSGVQKWRLPNPEDQYGSKNTRVRRVSTVRGVSGAERPNGNVPTPPVGDDKRLVQIGADRTARVIDVTTGKVIGERPNVADPRDLVLAHEGRLYVAGSDGGYRLAAYDLGNLGEPANLYTSADDQRRPEQLAHCGKERVCLLERANFDDETTELVQVDAGDGGVRWRRPAPETDQLRSVGEHILVRRTMTPYEMTLFTPDGETLIKRDGIGLRIDGGNVLVFAEALSSGQGNPSVAGLPIGSGQAIELGQLKAVRSESCSWNSSIIVCGTAEDFAFRRFAKE